MFKKKIHLAVICAMATGYRRADIALTAGENLLEVNQEQYDLLAADNNLTVTIVDADSGQGQVNRTLADYKYDNPDVAYLQEQNTTLKGEVISLSNQLADVKKQLAAAQVVTHEDTLTDLAGVGERTFGFDCSSAPEELHRWIAVIDDLNKETPLTKKPNCDHLTTTVDGEPTTPTAAQRDEAWEWYQNNVVIASTNSTDETGE